MSKQNDGGYAFPKYHPRAGEPTEFRAKFLAGEKVHTIRANENGYYKEGDIISVREWSGKPYRSKQVMIRDAVRIGVVPIYFNDDSTYAFIGKIPVRVLKSEIAENDGLALNDFMHWFFPQNLTRKEFRGSLIYLTDFRYGGF